MPSKKILVLGSLILSVVLGYSFAQDRVVGLRPLQLPGAALPREVPPQVEQPTKPQRIPATATALAIQEVPHIPPAYLPTTRWIWLPGGTQDEAAEALVVINTALNRSSTDYVTVPVAGGALLPVNFSQLADTQEEVNDLLRVWNSQAALEPDFTAHIHGPWNGGVHTWNIPAPHLLDPGIALEKAIGNIYPDRQTYLPIVRLNWFLWSSLSSIDGGKYLEFRGLRVGKTKLDEYLKRHGANEAQIKNSNSDERAAFISKVTGRARGVNVFQGSGVRPSVGSALIAVTDDNFYDRDDPVANPFYSLLDHKPDAHEVFVTLPSGWLEYTLWNGDGTLLAEAPPNVVSDHRIPDPFPTRLNGAISCMRCHAPQEMWKPFRNEVKDMLGDRVRVNADISGRGNVDQNLRRLGSLYSGDLNPALKLARDAFDRRCFIVAKVAAKKVLSDIADAYNEHEYTWIDAKIACSELGIEVPKEDLTGVVTFRRLIPPKSLDGTVYDDPSVGRLATDYMDEETGKRVGLTLTRREFSLIKADLYDRALEAHHN